MINDIWTTKKLQEIQNFLMKLKQILLPVNRASDVLCINLIHIQLNYGT